MKHVMLIALAGTALFTGCSDDEEGGGEQGLSVAGVQLSSQAFGLEAEAAANELWSQIEGWESWPLLPGTEERQASGVPHGSLATIRYLGADPAQISAGFVLLKENITATGELEALTVMVKAPGFDEANADWFYAKYLPDGSLDVTPTGAPLAGAVEPAADMGCRGCHRGAPGEDFVWEN